MSYPNALKTAGKNALVTEMNGMILKFLRQISYICDGPDQKRQVSYTYFPACFRLSGHIRMISTICGLIFF